MCSGCCLNLFSLGTLSICLACVSLATVQQAVGNPPFHSHCIHTGKKYSTALIFFYKALNSSWLSLVERCECGDAQSASSPCSEMLDKLDSPLLTTPVSVQSTACFHRDSSSQSPIPLQLTDPLASGSDPFDERALTYLVQRKAGLQISCRWQPSPSLSLCCRGVNSLRYLGLLPCPVPQETWLVLTSSPHGFTLR